jgi:HAD superfamily hydrolase (TIGR01490 family)
MKDKNEIASVFDFDGTLSKGFIWVEFIGYLHEKGIYNDKHYERQMQTLDNYNKGILPYDEWCEKWGLLWADTLTGVKREEVTKNASEFFKRFRNNIYASSYELVRAVKERGFTPVIISAGPYEVLSLAANDLGIGVLYATKLEERNGAYTGNVEANVFAAGAKEKIMAELGSRFDLKGSIGFGDSVGDIGMLEEVGIKVALNPSNELKKLANKRGWVIASKDDVVPKVSGRLSAKLLKTKGT